MIFIDQQRIQHLVNFLNNKATDNLDPQIKKKLSSIFEIFLKENYIDNTYMIHNFLSYNITEDYSNILFEQYGISSSYYTKINKLLKKSLAYYLERLAQEKGSTKTFKIFANLFVNIFGPLNFYQIIVTKRKVIKDNEVKYVLTYDLYPILITDRNILLSSFDDKVSLTKKHLMTLEQYADFNVFPAKTNLIYIQFNKSSGLVNNFKIFEPMLKAYAMTKLNKKLIQVKNFLDLPNFNLLGSDVYWILKFAEYTRIRLNQTKSESSTLFNFNAKFKAGYSMIYPYETLETIETFLYEYMNIDYTKRRELDNLKRKWRIFQNQNIKISLFENYEDMKNKLYNEYPDLINKIINFKTDDDYINFYFEFYNYVLSELSNDKYINYFLTFIFMNVLSNEKFINEIFVPVYNIFQKYFFPVEMSFLNKINDSIYIKDKFEALATDFKYTSKITTKKLDKYRFYPDKIAIFFKLKPQEVLTTVSKNFIWSVSKIKENQIAKDKNSSIIKSKFLESKKINDLIIVFINHHIKELINKNDDHHIILTSIEKNKITLNEKNYLKIKSDNKENLNKNVITKNKIIINKKHNDSYKMKEKNKNTIKRDDYTKYYDDLKIYLIFKNEKFRKLSAYLDNLNYSITDINDEIYFNLNPVFQ